MTTLEKKPTPAPVPAATEDRPAPAAFRPYVVGAVFRRNVQSYFSNPAGYVFITLFVFVSSWAAFWQPIFFANNLANLDALNVWKPFLLLFFIPAITMNTWAEERRQGTEELLFTLPARDVEVVLGKYLAALGIFTVALAFSLSHAIVLFSLGRPDPGVLFANYLGYWLMGAMFIAIGMVASLLSANVTVAFILGALFCAVPVFADLLGAPFGPATRRAIEALSVPAQFRDFGAGVIPLAGVFYFLSLAAGMLYLNMVLLGRRHWAGGERSAGRWAHALVRVVAVVVALVSLDVLVARAGVRTDVSAERLNTLSTASRRIIEQIPKERPVYIQAYYSPEVPREYVETKTNLINLLKEYAAIGGNKVRLNLIEAERYSQAARDAEKRFGITPRRVFTTDEARQASSEIILGVAFTGGLEEVVVPFFDRGLPVEYELTRSIRVVAGAGRKKVGILDTDAKLLGGFDFQSMGQDSEWSVVTELRKQYEVTAVSAGGEIPSDLDALLVAQPSSLTQPQIDNLTAYVRKGGATLLLVDPMPLVDMSMAPEEPKRPPGGMFGGGPPPEEKGNLTPLLDLLGIDWPTTQIVWNTYNPHPKLADLPPEVVFVGRGSGAADAFNPKQVASSGLQEVVLMFPGLVRSRGGADKPDFIPLLRTNDSGGLLDWQDAVQRGFLGNMGINPVRPHFATGNSYTLAARIEGKLPAETPAPDATKDAAKKAEPKAADARVIVVADLDMISEQFFDLRRRKVEDLDFDNVTFVLNCVDVLVGDESFIGLRKQRRQFRTLLALEAQANRFEEERLKEEKAAEDEAKAQLAAAQERLDKKVAAIRERTDLDARTKEIMLGQLEGVENRRLDVTKATIEGQKQQKIEESKADKEQKVRQIQSMVRLLAIVLPPLPALLLGCVVFAVRTGRENRGANPNRLA